MTRLTLGVNPSGVAFDPVTHQIFVVDYGSGAVTVINDTTFVASTITGGSAARGIAVDPATNMVYVAKSAGCPGYRSGGYSVLNGTTGLKYQQRHRPFVNDGRRSKPRHEQGLLRLPI